MSSKLAIVALSLLLGACASQKSSHTESGEASASSTKSASPSGGRVVKSTNGQFEGEIVGTPAPKSKFAKLKIGMTMREVTTLIGGPDDMNRHETGKRWIPFYGGNDAQRIEALYRGEGCLTFTGGNVWGGGGNELIRIAVDAKGACMND